MHMAREIKSISDLAVLGEAGRVEVHLGDATLLATLHSLGEGATAVVLDPQIGVSDQILTELDGGLEIFAFLRTAEEEVATTFSSILTHVLEEPRNNARLQQTYREAWELAQGNLDRGIFLPETIEEALAELGGSKLAIADEVTYHYPSPMFNPIFPALKLAASLLKPDGELVVTTEHEGVRQHFESWGGPFVVKSGYEQRDINEPPVSAYDVAWGKWGHHQVRLQNRDGELPDYLESMEQGLGFRILTWLGLVK